ncbi:hypothetical protein CBM2623_A100081 [Cupriavidus taiwanensis]|nr:hypothetical protein CBM2623_A100081 [Cupriavidus taiwanensis]
MQNALSPAPVRTTTPTDLSHEAAFSASISSSQVLPRKALYFCGRLMVMRATPSRTSYRISVYSLMMSLGPRLSLTVHGQAARYTDDLAGDEVGVIAGKKANDPRNVRRLPKALERDGSLEAFIDLLAVLPFAKERLEQRRVGRTGADDVDIDVVARAFACNGLAEGNDASFAGGVDRFTGRSDASGIGRDVDDLSLLRLDHPGQYRVMQVQRANQVDGNDLAPEVRCGLQKLRGYVPTGVVDQCIDATELFRHCVDRRFHRAMIGDIELDGRDTRASFLKRHAELLQRISVDVHCHHARAFLTETLAQRLANATGSAGDDDHFIFQTSHTATSWVNRY